MPMKPSQAAQEIQNPIDLKAQEKVIMTHLLHGNAEELRRLDQASIDPELHPAVRGLIQECRRRLPYYVSRQDNPMSMPVKVQL